MNWVGDLCSHFVDRDDTVLDLGCGLMYPILDTFPHYPKTRLQCRELTGLDIYKPYLQAIKHKVATVLVDLREKLPFQNKTFDVTLLLDTLEHVGLKLLDEAERVTRKTVLVLTPSIWRKNVENLSPWQHGFNRFQLHKEYVSPKTLRWHGYQIIQPRKHMTFAWKELK